MTNNQYTRQALSKFAREVVRQSRANLTRGKKNKGKLYKSLGFDLKVHKNSFMLGLNMEEYGAYQDKGVSGTKKKYNTPFSYKDKMPPREPILKWVNSKRMRLRDKETGKFKKGGQKSLAFLIQRSIYQKGIKPSLFFTKPFEKHFKNLPQEIIQAYGLDLDNVITER